MKHGITALALLCVLCIPALGGDIPTVGVTPPPPPPDGMQSSTLMTPGDIPSGGLTYEIADTTLDLMQMLLGFAM